MKKISSDSGNWTRVSRVTGGDTSHYTKSDLLMSLRYEASFKVITPRQLIWLGTLQAFPLLRELWMYTVHRVILLAPHFHQWRSSLDCMEDCRVLVFGQFSKLIEAHRRLFLSRIEGSCSRQHLYWHSSIWLFDRRLSMRELAALVYVWQVV